MNNGEIAQNFDGIISVDRVVDDVTVTGLSQIDVTESEKVDASQASRETRFPILGVYEYVGKTNGADFTDDELRYVSWRKGTV